MTVVVHWLWPLALGAVVAMVVHEASHAVAALLVGGRRVRLVRRGFFWAVAAELPGSRWAEVAFVAAGPLANLVLGGVAGAAGPHLWLFGAVQVLSLIHI